MHDGQEVHILRKPKGNASAEPWHDYPPVQSGASKGKSPPTTAAENMVNVDVDVAGNHVTAMVDTGCSFPMAIPQQLADALIQNGRAINAGVTKSMLADGKTQDVEVIMISSITVDGRTLRGVEASVSPGDGAPILLGLGALNQLGAFKIEEGRIVFTDGQPA